MVWKERAGVAIRAHPQDQQVENRDGVSLEGLGRGDGYSVRRSGKSGNRQKEEPKHNRPLVPSLRALRFNQQWIESSF